MGKHQDKPFMQRFTEKEGFLLCIKKLKTLCIARPDLAEKITQKYKELPPELSSLSSLEYLLGGISGTVEEILLGPVYCYERELVSQGNTISRGFGDQTLSLIGSSTIQ